MPSHPDGFDVDALERALTRRQVLRGAAGGAVFLGAGGLLAACGGGGGKPAATTGPAKAIKRGGSVRVGVTGGGSKDTVDAHKVTSDADVARTRQLYEPVALRDESYNIEMVLAESIEPRNKKLDEWIIKLRPDVSFHNGRALTADDMIYTIRRILNPKVATTVSSFIDYVDPTRLKKLDKLTVSVPLKSPKASFLDDIGQYSIGIVPVGYDPRKPVGTGPYKFKSLSPSEQSVFTRNDHYWRDGPNFDQITILDLSDDTARLNALSSGQVDAISNVPSGQIAALRRASGTELLISHTGNFQPITMRVDKAPFNDVRVRQAFKLIVNREQMVAQAFSGQGRPGNDIPSPFDPMYATDIPQHHQDIEKAKSLLKAAGRSGVTVQLVTSPIYSSVVEAAQVFGQQAKAAGVSVGVQKVDTSSFFGPGYLTRTFSQDFWFTRSLLGQIAYEFLPASSYNESHWSNKAFRKLVNEAQATADEAKRRELLGEAQKLMWEDSGVIIHTFSNQVDAYRSDLTGFKPNKNGSPLDSYNFRTTGRT